MEKNVVETLDEIEQDIIVDNTPKKELKEYEKLLLAEQNRKDAEKAKNLVNLGCFDQKQQPKFDYNGYVNVPLDKKFKGVYLLYKNVETGSLVYVCPLVEDNKGDIDERKDLKPYSYDLIFVEDMDEETYEEVLKAGKNNLHTFPGVLWVTSLVLYCVNLACMIYVFIVNLISLVSGSSFASEFASVLYYTAPFFTIFALGTPLLMLGNIKYKKYKGQK